MVFVDNTLNIYFLLVNKELWNVENKGDLPSYHLSYATKSVKNGFIA
ncbi:hypothetical protein BB14905_11460 [Bacillus sp. B14905]|nr:hypothetical protein BB14905_11460 [Bacillus sp. B14905]